ncbi:hypothetical protein ACVWZK_002971 [Bradyrhizobium sp. GM0.4]
MSTNGVKIPAKRSLLIVAGAVIALAGIIAGYGFMSRAQSKQVVVDWTNQQTTATVFAGVIHSNASAADADTAGQRPALQQGRDLRAGERLPQELGTRHRNAGQGRPGAGEH